MRGFAQSCIVAHVFNSLVNKQEGGVIGTQEGRQVNRKTDRKADS